jgi:hypothetical protein
MSVKWGQMGLSDFRRWAGVIGTAKYQLGRDTTRAAGTRLMSSERLEVDRTVNFLCATPSRRQVGRVDCRQVGPSRGAESPLAGCEQRVS